jgi:EmrB/QacA subfamily drug resistance transporter
VLERRWWTLIAVCVATFMLLLDVTIVNVALPEIQRDLDAEFSDLQWVIDAYALMLAALLLTAGALADLLGRRRVFVLGLALFTAASLLCALAGTPLVLNLSRGLQGVGAAMMFATSLALLAQEFQGPDRGAAFGAWGATTGGAVAVGPLIGGALTEGFGWESIFLLNLPIGAAAIVLTLTKVNESQDPRGGRVDWAGLLTFSSALFLLVFSLIRGNEEGWGSTRIVAQLVLAAALMVVFVAVERRQERPMLELSLFRKPTFTGAAIAAFALSASMFAMFLYITLYIQNVLGYEPLETGLRFLPITLLSFFVAPIAGKLSARLPVRAFLGGGLIAVGVGLLLMRGIEPQSDWTTLLAGFVIGGVGIGLINPPLASAAIGVVEPARSGMASGINSTFRQVGIATGIAGLGAIFQSRVESGVTERLAGTPLAGRAEELSEAVATAGAGGVIESAPAGAREILGEAARASFVDGLNEIFLVAAIIALIGGVLAFVLVRGRDFVVQAAADPHGAEPQTVAGRPAAPATA